MNPLVKNYMYSYPDVHTKLPDWFPAKHASLTGPPGTRPGGGGASLLIACVSTVLVSARRFLHVRGLLSRKDLREQNPLTHSVSRSPRH